MYNQYKKESFKIFSVEAIPAVRKYLSLRGITDEDVTIYDISAGIQGNRIFVVFPIKNFSNVVIGRIFRNILPIEPRYLAEGSASLFIYNIEKAFPSAFRKGFIAVTEGPFDVIHLDKRGIPTIGILGGGNLSRFKLEVLSFLKRKGIFLIDAFDKDDQGRGFAGSFEGKFDVCIWDVLPANPCKDVADYFTRSSR